MDFDFIGRILMRVSKTLFFVLLALSMISWVVGIMRVINSRRRTANIVDELTAQINIQNLGDLPFDQRKMATEQKLLQQIARHRYELEKGLPVLGTTASIAPLLGCLVRFGDFSCPSQHRCNRSSGLGTSGRACG